MQTHLLALLLIQQTPPAAIPHVESVEKSDLGQPLSGSDYLLVAEAARHPEMKRVNLACFNIFVYEQEGARHVAFVERKNRLVERKTQEGTVIEILPLDPLCRSISFEMTREGRVGRVIRSRH